MRTTLTFKTLPLEIEFEYIPGEERTMNYGDGNGYPGCGPKVDIARIYFKDYYSDINITSFFEETGLIYEIEEAILNELEKE